MLKVLSIGYGRHLFEENDRERKRLEACAAGVDELHVIVFSSKHEGLKNTSGENKLYLYPTNAGNKLQQLFLGLKLAFSILKKADPKDWVITAQDPFETGLLAFIISSFKKIPFNVQEHGDFYSTDYWCKDTRLNRIRHRLGKIILKRANTVRVVSRRIKNTLVKMGVNDNKILELAVRTDHNFDQSVRPYDYGFEEDTVVILTMARLVTQKNLPLLMKSFSNVVKDFEKARLVIIGTGPEKDRLKKMQTELELEDKVRFFDWTDSPIEHFKAADIYALSSNWEGWARVLIEAMVLGLPVVTTDVGCAKEVLKNNEHGFVVPVNDEKEFTDKLLQLVKNEQLRKTFSENSLRVAPSLNMSERDYAAAWQDVLEKTKNRGY